MDYLIGSGSMLVLDSIYLSIVKQNWQNMIKNIQKSTISLRFSSAVAVYLLMSFALYYFIIKPNRSVYDAILLGIVIYGVFDFTNYALFKEYSLLLALTDMLWGGILFGSSAFIVKKIFNKK